MAPPRGPPPKQPAEESESSSEEETSSSEEESSDESPAPTRKPAAPVPTLAAATARRKFEDEEDSDDVADNWSDAEDDEEQAEKLKAQEKVRAEAAAKKAQEEAANKKTGKQRVEERIAARKNKPVEDDASSEDEAAIKERLRKTEKDADLKNAEALFSSMGVKERSTPIIAEDPNHPGSTIDLTTLPIFNPSNKESFVRLREALVPILQNASKKAQYPIFLQEFVRLISKECGSEQIKKIASTLTTLSNEKMKEEKVRDGMGKKTKAAKTKSTLNANRGGAARVDTNTYDDNFGEEDFM